VRETIQVDHVAVATAHGLPVDLYYRMLKKATVAKETKLIKIRALTKPLNSQEQDANVVTTNSRAGKRGRTAYRTIYEGGIMEDTVIAVDMVNWSIREGARESLGKIHRVYPAEKVDHKHEGTVFVNTGIMRPMDDTPGQGIAVPGSSSRADTAAEVQK